MPLSAALRRLRAARRPRIELERQPDERPKRGLFAEPIRVEAIKVLEPEPVDGGHRVTFLVEVRDADGKRCSDLFVEARVRNPAGQRTVEGTTDLLGRIRFRTTGGAGQYGIDIRDVAAGGLRFDRDASTLSAATEIH